MRHSRDHRRSLRRRHQGRRNRPRQTADAVAGTRHAASGRPQFLGYNLWTEAIATGADLIWRAKSHVYFVPTEVLPDGSYLAIMPTPREANSLSKIRRRYGRNEIPVEGQPIRVVEFTVTIHTDDGSTRTEKYRLVTTLLDHVHAPAVDIAALYQQRWESETSYSYLKPRLVGADVTLRSRTPDGIAQELYAFLVVYQALITLRVDAATAAHLDPDRISFLITIRAVRADLTSHTPLSAGRRRRAVLTDIVTDQIGPRRSRTSPRQRILRAATKYPPKNRDNPQHSTRTKHEIRITAPN